MDELSADASLFPLPHNAPAWVIYIILTLPNLALPPIASNVQYGGRSSFDRSATTGYTEYQLVRYWIVSKRYNSGWSVVFFCVSFTALLRVFL